MPKQGSKTKRSDKRAKKAKKAKAEDAEPVVELAPRTQLLHLVKEGSLCAKDTKAGPLELQDEVSKLFNLAEFSKPELRLNSHVHDNGAIPSACIQRVALLKKSDPKLRLEPGADGKAHPSVAAYLLDEELDWHEVLLIALEMRDDPAEIRMDEAMYNDFECLVNAYSQARKKSDKLKNPDKLMATYNVFRKWCLHTFILIHGLDSTLTK